MFDTKVANNVWTMDDKYPTATYNRKTITRRLGTMYNRKTNYKLLKSELTFWLQHYVPHEVNKQNKTRDLKFSLKKKYIYNKVT